MSRAASSATPLSTDARVARTVAFTALSVALGAMAHSLCMGASPTHAALLFATAAVALVAWPLAAKTRSATAICLAVLGVQAALHALFAATMVRSQRLMLLCTAHAHLSTTRLSWTGGGGWMIAGHAAAALGVALWLARAEAAVTAAGRTVRALAGRIRRAVPQPLTVASPAAAPARVTPTSLLSRFITDTLAGRAPPHVALI